MCIPLRVQGFKDSNHEPFGPKYYGIWDLKPSYLGPWTLRVLFGYLDPAGEGLGMTKDWPSGHRTALSGSFLTGLGLARSFGSFGVSGFRALGVLGL